MYGPVALLVIIIVLLAWCCCDYYTSSDASFVAIDMQCKVDVAFADGHCFHLYPYQ